MNEEKISSAVNIMIQTDRMHKHLLDTNVSKIGLHRTQHRILMHLSRDGMLPSQKELADRLDITPAAVTIALKKVENAGYVERSLGHDTRYNELKITEKGRVLVNRTRELFFEADTAMFEGFSDEELETYVSFLEKIQNNIQKQSTERINK